MLSLERAICTAPQRSIAHALHTLNFIGISTLPLIDYSESCRLILSSPSNIIPNESITRLLARFDNVDQLLSQRHNNTIPPG